MDYRRAAQIAEWTLAALVVGLHLGIFLWPETRGQPQFLLTSAHDAQLFSGVVLLLAWAMFGPGRWRLRLLVLPFLLIGWSLPWNTRMIPRGQHQLPFLVAGLAAVAVIVARLCGFRMQRLDPAAGRERGAQFSLLGLLVVTTLVAAAIGGLEALRPILVRDRGGEWDVLRVWISGEPNPTHMSPLVVRRLVLAAAVSLAAFGGLWVVARPGALWFRLSAVAVTVPILAAYFANLSGEPSERTTIALNLGLGLSLVAALTGLSVLPLRMFDFRLQRTSPAASTAKSQVSQRSRLQSRAAVLSVVALLLGAWLLSGPVVRRYASQLKPPAEAFASWISPPPPNIWKDFRVYRVSTQYYIDLQAMGWQIEQNQVLTEPVIDVPNVQPPFEVKP